MTISGPDLAFAAVVVHQEGFGLDRAAGAIGAEVPHLRSAFLSLLVSLVRAIDPAAAETLSPPAGRRRADCDSAKPASCVTETPPKLAPGPACADSGRFLAKRMRWNPSLDPARRAEFLARVIDGGEKAVEIREEYGLTQKQARNLVDHFRYSEKQKGKAASPRVAVPAGSGVAKESPLSPTAAAAEFGLTKQQARLLAWREKTRRPDLVPQKDPKPPVAAGADGECPLFEDGPRAARPERRLRLTPSPRTSAGVAPYDETF